MVIILEIQDLLEFNLFRIKNKLILFFLFKYLQKIGFIFIEYIDKFNIDIDFYKCLEILEDKNKEIKKIIINYIQK